MAQKARRPVDKDAGLALSPVADAVAAGGADVWRVHYSAVALKDAGYNPIILTVGDPDFDTPHAVIEAGVAAMRGGQTHYTISGGDPPLLRALADLERARLGRAVEPAHIACAGGAQNVLYSVFRCLLTEGDEAILLSPPYTMFPGVIASCGAKVVNVPLDVADGFKLDVDAVARAITSDTQAILANFPHNPSGACATRESMTALVRLCEDNGIWLISDEAYSDLTYDEPFFSPGMLESDHVIVVRSLSKSHAMTGWRVGWSVATASLTAVIADFVSHVTYGAPGFIQAGALAAITQEHSEVAAMRDAYLERRDRFVATIDKVPGLSAHKPAAGIFCMVDVRDAGFNGVDFADQLLEQQMVSVLPGSAFAPELDGFVRVALTVPPEQLEEAARRMARLVGNRIPLRDAAR